MIDILKIGPLNIYIPYLFYILSILITILYGIWLTKKHNLKLNQKKPADLILEYWLIFIVIWKLSYFIYHPRDLIQNPFAIIYFDGGDLGIVLGFLSVIGYSVIQLRKNNIALEVQSILILSSAFIFIGINSIVSFLYVNNILILLEGLTYLFIASQFLVNRNIKTIVTQLKLFRWSIIFWVFYRVILNEIDLYFIWLLTALIASVVLIFIEWNGTERERG